MSKITPVDISDPQELIARAIALGLELAIPITPGFEALAFKASHGIEGIYELTYIRKDSSRFPAVVSVTALRNDLMVESVTDYAIVMLDPEGHVMSWNAGAERINYTTNCGRHRRTAPVAQAQVHTDAPLCTLFYVEDNQANLKLVEQPIARRPDMRLLSAADGHLGIEIAHAFQPEVILMDINLPGISGIEALKILREDPATAHIPVVVLSANAIPRDIVKGLEAGFFRYLTRPIKVNEFLYTLDEALAFAEKWTSQCN